MTTIKTARLSLSRRVEARPSRWFEFRVFDLHELVSGYSVIDTLGDTLRQLTQDEANRSKTATVIFKLRPYFSEGWDYLRAPIASHAPGGPQKPITSK